jgi:5,5'-dehydrodivanillate O-demethylase
LAMLTVEQNEVLTQVGPGTPMGNLLRRYWHPVGATVTFDRVPVQPVRLLGEALVLYRDKRGTFGLLTEACPHHGSSLAAGSAEKEGLRCRGHGWRYDERGQCVEQPMEPTQSKNQQRPFRTTAYTAQEMGGLVFAYLGPEPKPLLPRYNVLGWRDAARETNGTLVPCNWLQVTENLLDPFHVEYLHGLYFAYVLGRKPGGQLDEFMADHYPRPMKRIGFDLFEHGIVERHAVTTEQEFSWAVGTPTYFPSTSLLSSRASGSLIFVVPIDDTHTWLLFHMAERTGLPQSSAPFFDVPGIDAAGAFITDTANGQDHMAVVTQGAIARREIEHLGSSDVGIVLYRELLMRQMERVERGQDPMNVHRKPTEDRVITFPSSGGLPGTTRRSRSVDFVREEWDEPVAAAPAASR